MLSNHDQDAGGNGGVDDPDAGGDADPDAEGEDVPCTGSDCPAKNADGADGAVVTDDSGEKFQTGYPSPFLTNEQVQNGGFMVYLFGILYSFIGIALVTQGYINPAIDIIKKKGILGSDTMNATLLAFSNSAAESFIVMNSIFFGVSDIGIQTAVQQCAFYALVIQGLFYNIAPEKTRIDWWISTRDSILFMTYLGIMSAFMQGD